MIYTITFNPAVDYIFYTDKICTGALNRSEKEEIYFGGKGINVSMVLKELDVPSVALGFVAGFTGEAIEKGIKEKGIETDFVHLENGFSRINVKVKADVETELNGQGPDISDKAIEELFGKLERLCDGDTLILSGSIPKTLPEDMYVRIMECVQEKDVRVVVDAAGKLLINTLKYGPFLIKPNKEELEGLFEGMIGELPKGMAGKLSEGIAGERDGDDTGSKMNSDDIVQGAVGSTVAKVTECARRLQELGARNVLVSLGGDGAVLLDETGRVHVCGACQGEVVSSVGAGDSMVAGFIAGFEQSGGDYEYALKLGTAAGGATAFSGGLATKERIWELMRG